MQSRLIITYVLPVMFLLMSCNKGIDDQQLQGKWNFGTIESESKSVEGIDTDGYSDIYIFLQPESQATSLLFGTYLNSTWSFNDKDSILSIQKPNHKTIKFKVMKYSEDELWLSLKSNKDHKLTGTKIVFFKEEQKLLSSKYNYTKAEYNQFRMPPVKSETPQQIRQRVKQSVEYALVFFRYSIEQEKPSIKLNSINLPIGFYNNGVSVIEPTEKWNDIFYSEEEALMGYEMLRDVFDHHMNLPEHKSGMELNEYILNEMYKRL